MAAAMRGLRVHRSALLIVFGLAAIVAGIWLVVAAVFGAAVGAGVGLALSGLGLLLIEGLSEGTP